MSFLCLFSVEMLNILQIGFVRVVGFWGFLWVGWQWWGRMWVLFFNSRIVYKELLSKTSTMKKCRCKRRSQKCGII